MGSNASRTNPPQVRFLEKLAETGNVTEAARLVGWGRTTAYDHKARDPDFAIAWDSALEEAADGLRKEARRRGVTGWLEPVFYQGKRCGAIRRYSDTLLCRLLAAHCPEHREKGSTTIRLAGDENNPIKVEVDETPERALRIATILAEIGALKVPDEARPSDGVVADAIATAEAES